MGPFKECEDLREARAWMFLEALFVTQSHHRINARRPSRRNVARDERRRREQRRDSGERRHVGRRHAEQQAANQLRGRRSAGEADRDARRREPHRFAQHHSQHVGAVAPSARRTPISCVRSATAYAMTP